MSLANPFRNNDDLQEFREALYDYAPNIERLVAELTRHPGEPTLIADLFRAFHNIKGDASLCGVAFVVPFAHSVESLLARLRAGTLQFKPVLAELILLTLDRLELAVDALAARQSIDHLRLPYLEDALAGLAELDQRQLDRSCRQLLEKLTGFRADSPLPLELEQETGRGSDTERADDLRFFRHLALQMEHRLPLFEGRISRNLKLALDTNTAAGSPVDAVQLEAAVYMHDLGMMLLPEAIWLQTERLSEIQRRQLSLHPGWGAGLLARMPGWDQAVDMVLQHHEKQDGSGYPAGLAGDAIVPGAKILALVDAFEAVMVKHHQRGQHRSVLRAIAEVNASDRQFDPAWVTPFNAVIRTMLENRPR
ncbi:HD domain-containing phosphohydrolase [Andreprevotia sp. IGB-42]|uniref:HD domain-containing phosphohydrolase n=1 Tax=Andreprevotia sp. IGB-42 TaxID=2497473 RepID=UPI001357971F|nr:HD domain-containing phosphohydrolase [Andreprevotia sp. IGB-42]